MLNEVLMALSAAGGTAVVQAAGTDAWAGFRGRVAKLFSRGDAQREATELERLDQTAVAVVGAGPGETERVRIRQESSWQTRFESLLEGLSADERDQVAAELRAVLDEHADVLGSVSAGPGGLAVGGNLDIRAEDGSIAAGVINGGAAIGSPPKPDPVQG
ncbi:hypothetical protein KUF83_31405 [Streptomyces sp. BV286]|nr:hypothetical protein [Streptomyces sp. BV286]